jgi:predicted NBD/HSP70 family sugar kinase
MYLLFDIGATNMRLGLSDGQKIIRYVMSPTPAKFSQAVHQLSQMAITLNAPQKIKKVVGGIAGPLDKTRTTITDSFLTDWIGKPIKKEISKIAGAPVELYNDCELAGLGEAVYGAGKKYNIVAYLTFSTGFNGARIVNKTLDASSYGYELDQQIVQVGNKLTTIEPHVSARHLEKKYKTQITQTNPKIWYEYEQWMIAAINNTAVYWSPDVIVLGGGASLNPRVKTEPIKKFVHNNLTTKTPPAIVKGKIKDINGLYGAFALVASKKPAK